MNALRLLKKHEDKIKAGLFYLALGYAASVAVELVDLLGAGKSIALGVAVWVSFVIGRQKGEKSCSY